MIAYPKSKVILTVRDVVSWAHLFQRNKHGNEELEHCASQYLFGNFSSPKWLKSAVRYAQYGTPCSAALQMVKRYLLHNRAVIGLVPPERLLVLDIINGTGEPHNKLTLFLVKMCQHLYFLKSSKVRKTHMRDSGICHHSSIG